MHDKRRLTDPTMELIKAWSKRLTLEEQLEDDPNEPSLEDKDSYAAYVAGILDGKTELARDILEAQDLINYN